MRASNHYLLTWYSPFALGGVQTFLKNFAGEARQRDCEVTVAATNSAEGPFAPAFAGIRRLDWTSFHAAFMGNRSSERAVCETILGDLANVKPSVLFINDCASFGIACAPLLKRLRPVCHVVDILHTNKADESYIANRAPYVKYLDGVVGTSDHVVNRFRNHFRSFDPARVRYIPYGVPGAASPRAASNPPEIRLLYVGRLERQQKRIQDLPPILVELQSRGIPFRLTLVGEGAERGWLEQQVKQHSFAECVTFLGFLSQERVAEQYRTHDVVLNLADYETGPMTVLEGMLGGCVPICTDVPCIAQSAIQHGRNGMLCPVGDAIAFAAAIGEVASQIEDMRVAATDAGRQFTIPKMVDNYFSFLIELESRRATAPWPIDSSQIFGRLEKGWNLSINNPWIPHPHPLRRLAARLKFLVTANVSSNS